MTPNLRLQVAGSQPVQLKIIVLWCESLGVRTPYPGGRQQRISLTRDQAKTIKVGSTVSDLIVNLVPLIAVGLVYPTWKLTPV